MRSGGAKPKPLNGASEDAHSNDTRDAERAFPARIVSPSRQHDMNTHEAMCRVRADLGN